MAFILNIDTATETAIVSLSEEKTVLNFMTNSDQKDHASFLHPSIKNLLDKARLNMNKLDAVAVTAGPGSYTGLRVGMAAAKGLCYALNIPLITVSTLEVMALSTIREVKDGDALYCPLIDARRMEVFTAVYDFHLTEKINPCSLVLDDGSFRDLLKTATIYFSGSGSEKLKGILNDKNALFAGNEVIPDSMVELTHKKFRKKDFADVAYASPVYIKEFYTPAKKA